MNLLFGCYNYKRREGGENCLPAGGKTAAGCRREEKPGTETTGGRSPLDRRTTSRRDVAGGLRNGLVLAGSQQEEWWAPVHSNSATVAGKRDLLAAVIQRGRRPRMGCQRVAGKNGSEWMEGLCGARVLIILF